MRGPSPRSWLSLIASLAVLGASTAGQAPDAGAVLAAARAALGGDAALTAVTTVVATGRTRQIRGNNMVPVEFEIVCQLPDACVRSEEYPAQTIDPTTVGFRGETVIQLPAPPAGTSPPSAARLVGIQQEFARLLVGVFAGSVTTYPLTFSYAAEAEAPDGKADVLNVLGPSNFANRLVIQRESHLPVMLIWQAPGGSGPGSPTTGPPVAVEHRLYYSDYRAVSGIKWPFRLRRAIAGTTMEETTFDRVSVNVRIDPRKLEAPR